MSNYKLPKLYDANGELNKRWFVFYNFRNPDSSKMERFRIFISNKLLTKTARYKKANDIIDLYTNKLISGWDPFRVAGRQNISLPEALDIILTMKTNSLRPRSVQSYRSLIGIFNEFLELKAYTKTLASEFNYYQAREFMDWVLNDRGVANRTYNNYLLNMRSIFNSMNSRHYTTVNPFKAIDTLPKTQAPIIAYTEAELELISQELPKFDSQLYLAAMLVFYCFLRPQEIVRLKVWQINIPRGEITILGKDTKNKKQNSIAIPEPLLEILANYSIDGNPAQFVFSRKLKAGNKQIAPTRLAERWREFANSVNLPVWKGMYDLKHTGAGMCVDAGINLRDLQIHLRHSSLEQTQVYLEKFRSITSSNLTKNFPTLGKQSVSQE